LSNFVSKQTPGGGKAGGTQENGKKKQAGGHSHCSLLEEIDLGA